MSPALFMAGFSLRSSQLQRVFAMIELMRRRRRPPAGSAAAGAGESGRRAA